MIEDIEENISSEEKLAIIRLTRDQINSARLLSKGQARWLVRMYEKIQKDRIRAESIIRSKNNEPNELIQYFGALYKQLEYDMKTALEKYALSTVPGTWALSQVGIGPVISASLLAYIDVDIATTSGDVWAYCGLDPNRKWEKGEKRPWNASMKRIMYLMGVSFMKSSNKPNSYYGRLYRLRKEYEIAKNERFEYASQAGRILGEKNFRDDTTAKEWYLKGQLPPAHIQRRSERWAAKMFMSHYFHVAYSYYHKKLPPLPWVFLDHPNHHAHPIADYYPPPNWPLMERIIR